MPSLTPSSELNALIMKHIDSVHAAANRLRVPEAVRDELVSAGYEALVLASRRYEPTAKATFGTFSFRPVLGSMFDCLASQSRWSSRHAPMPADEESVPCAAPPDAPRTTLTAQVMAALEELPPLSKDLIKAHFLAEDTLSSAGARHGMSKTRTSVHLARAIEQLREKLDDGFVEWPAATKAAKRRFTEAYRADIIRRALEPGANILQISRDYDVPPATIHTWLKPFRKGDAAQARLAA